MKVHIDNVLLTGTAGNTGPNTFARRLMMGLFENGIEIVESGTDADVSIVFIQRSGAPLAKKVVQRLDGIWFKPDNFIANNAKIVECYNIADAVVFQSKFDAQMVTKWFGSKRNSIIHNGIDIEKRVEPSNEALTAIKSLRQKYSRIFVCSSNWHPQKRLAKNIELYLRVKKSILEPSCLIVMGSRPDVIVTTNDIMYTGSVSHDDCLHVYKNADWMFHLAWADHCPNVVIEALSCDLPVVCSNVGGTAELVGKFGLVVDDQQYDFDLFDYDNPPKIDVTKVSLPEKTSLGKPGVDVNMKRVVQEYVQLLRSLL